MISKTHVRTQPDDRFAFSDVEIRLINEYFWEIYIRENITT